MVELLKQPASSPVPVGREIVSIWAGTTGKMDEIPVADIRRFEGELLDYIGHSTPELFDTLANAKSLDDDMVASLEKVLEEFTKQFQPSETEESGPSDTEGGPGRGANEGGSDAPEAQAQKSDNPSADGESAGSSGDAEK
jgi:F-type H+-transporting ATPase subunit alpha